MKVFLIRVIIFKIFNFFILWYVCQVLILLSLNNNIHCAIYFNNDRFLIGLLLHHRHKKNIFIILDNLLLILKLYIDMQKHIFTTNN